MDPLPEAMDAQETQTPTQAPAPQPELAAAEAAYNRLQAGFEGLQAELIVTQEHVTQLTQQRASHLKPLKTKEPEVFHGKQGEDVIAWSLGMDDYMATAASQHPEAEKLAYAAGALRGNARIWWHSQKTAASKGELTTTLPTTWPQLRTALIKQHQPINDSRLARDKLASLRQTGSVQTLVFLFRSLILRISDLSEGEKMDRFLRALKPTIQKELEVKNVTTFEEACTMAERVDRIIFTGGFNNSNHSNKSKYGGTNRGIYRGNYNGASRHASSYSANTNGPTPMELGAVQVPGRFEKLSPEERETLRRTGRCFYCRQPGHRAIECPLKKRNGAKGKGGAR